MIDDLSTNFNLPLPHVKNVLEQDVERLRSTINQIDSLLKNNDNEISALRRNLTTEKDTLSGEISALKQTIAQLQTEKEELKTLIYAALGK